MLVIWKDQKKKEIFSRNFVTLFHDVFFVYYTYRIDNLQSSFLKFLENRLRIENI